MIGRRQLVLGVIGGILLAAPIVFVAVVDQPTAHGTTPAFIENRTQLHAVLEEPYVVEFGTNDPTYRWLAVDPDRQRVRGVVRDRDKTTAYYVSSTRSCSRDTFTHRDAFESELRWRNTSTENVTVENESMTIIERGSGGVSIDEQFQGYSLVVGAFDSVRWRRAGTATLHGRNVHRYEPVDSWGYHSDGPAYYENTSGEALVHPESGVIYRVNMSARPERVDTHAEALLTDPGSRVRLWYRVQPSVSADRVEAPAFC
jgi:hypothetical protein